MYDMEDVFRFCLQALLITVVGGSTLVVFAFFRWLLILLDFVFWV